MSHPGIGAMLHYLSGGSQHSSDEYIGATVTKAEITDDKLNLDFADGRRVSLWDNGQSCCESRYMRTDDDLQGLVGKQVTAITVKHTEEPGEYDAHEIAFVEIACGDSHVVIANHNEHKGYYGGFGLTITDRATA